MGKYFFITTFDCQSGDEEEEACREMVTVETDGRVLSSPSLQDRAEFNPLRSHSNYHYDDGAVSVNVERYVHMSKRSVFKQLPGNVRMKMKAKAAVIQELARFQLVDRRDRQEKTLLESDWLPDEREMRGQPFFLRPYYHISNCIGISMRGGGGGGGGVLNFSLSRISSHQEGHCYMLFQLVKPDNKTTTD